MTQNEFLKILKEDILETDMDIGTDTLLSDMEEWDSLAYVNFIAVANTVCDTVLDRARVQQAKTVGDLYTLLK